MKKYYKNIEELFGLDLDENAINDLRKARIDRETGNKNAYVDMDSIRLTNSLSDIKK